MVMELIFPFIIVIPFVIGYMLGESKGVTKGADEMYTHLYNRGVRKNDHVIVKLEYEDRSETQEF
tara:strand:- start:1531 stop:1725 length:195 start_codon:yes stop_codon:yes gene_type:complete